MEERIGLLVQGFKAELLTKSLGKETIRYYGCCCDWISAQCEVKCGGVYDDISRKALAEALATRVQEGEIGPVYYSANVKVLLLLSEYQRAGGFDWRRRRPEPDALCECFADVLCAFCASLEGELASGSIELIETISRQLMQSLERSGHHSFAEIGHGDIAAFMTEAKERNRAGTGNVVWTLKRLFRFLNERGDTGIRVDAMLSGGAPRRIRALPCLTRGETDRVLAATDTSTAIGKRDYAIICTALLTGLRGVDILGLRLADINWREDAIAVVQQKTCEPLALPLTAEVGNAIADYILEGRPDTDDPHVFVRAKRPHTGLVSAPNIMCRALERAGISHDAYDGKSFHALRRSAGTRLIESGASIEMAAQILGHARIDSSKRYISLDTEVMRQCCLPLEGLGCAKEGLS